MSSHVLYVVGYEAVLKEKGENNKKDRIFALLIPS